MLLLHLALAGPVERLEDAIAHLPASSPHAGVLHHQGHGPTPGATTDHPFNATASGPLAQWMGDGWTDSAWIDGQVWNGDGDTWTLTDLDASTLAIQLLAAHPKQLLAHMAAQPARLAEAGPDILWSTPDGLWTLSLTDGRPVRLSCEKSHPVFGDVTDGVRWDWGPKPAVHIDMTDDDTRWTADLTPMTSKVAVELREPPRRVASVRLDPTTWVLQVPEANGRSLMTVVGQQGVVFDAPLSSALGAALLVEAQALAPEVTHWTVVVSHHHPHYSGGLRPWARAGATIVVPASIEGTVRVLLTEPRTLDPKDPAVPKPTLIAVTDRLDLHDGAVQVRAIDSASGHTDSFLLSYLSASKTLYVADLARRSTGESKAKHRGTWAGSLKPWAPEVVVSGWPLEGSDDVGPVSSLP